MNEKVTTKKLIIKFILLLLAIPLLFILMYFGVIVINSIPIEVYGVVGVVGFYIWGFCWALGVKFEMKKVEE